MIGAHVIVDSSTLAAGPQGAQSIGPATLFLTVLGWRKTRPEALQFTRPEDAQAYLEHCRRDLPALVRGRVVTVFHDVEGAGGVPQARGRVTTDNDPFAAAEVD